MKVLNVAETTKGGIETYFGSLSRSKKLNNEFLAIGYDASIIEIEDKKSRIKNLLILCYVLFFKVKLKSYDVIFLHSTFAGLLRVFVYPYAKIFKIKVAYCSHGWAFDMQEKNQKSFKTKIYIFIEKLLTHFNDIVFCISQADITSAKQAGIREDKLVLNWNGVRESKSPYQNTEYKADAQIVKVLFVGRLDRQKGLYEFLIALKNIASALNYNVKFTIIGEPVRNDNPQLLRLLETTPKHIRIEHLGWIKNDDLDNHYQIADFIVVPSLWEGFGLIVAEALRNGKPVLASNVGSLPHMINDKTGWLFDIKNPNSLENTLKTVINEQLYKKISADDCVTHFFQNFHEDIMNKNYHECFEKLYA